jgi:hypothetical protein
MENAALPEEQKPTRNILTLAAVGAITLVGFGAAIEAVKSVSEFIQTVTPG